MGPGCEWLTGKQPQLGMLFEAGLRGKPFIEAGIAR